MTGPTSPLAPDRDAKVRASFAAQGLMTTLGAEIVALSAGGCTITAPVREGSSQQHGHGHAGLTFAIGDSAAGYAALTLFPDDREVLTVEMKINLMAPASGPRLIAEGRVIRAGRRLAVVAADVWSEGGDKRRHVATLQGTMIPV